ncbi:MAG: rhodanese-like domain-containing protein [Tessaracoccus sp.]
MAEITVTETDQRRDQARILDVREDFEVADGMIPGALHIPMGQLQTRLSELTPTSRSSPSAAAGTGPPRSLTRSTAGYTADTMAGGMTA